MSPKQTTWFIVFATFIPILGMAGLSYGLIELNSVTRALSGELDKKLTKNADQLSSIQSLVAELNAEQTRIKQEVDGLLARRDVNTEPQANHWLNKPEPPQAGSDREIGTSVQEIETRGSVSIVFEQEWGQSNWGQSSATAIHDAFQRSPFFSKYGGDLLTECRETTCRLEWLVPDPDSLPAKDREKMFAMIDYEMLALAARNATEVGEINTEWKVENGQRSITVFFKKSTQVP